MLGSNGRLGDVKRQSLVPDLVSFVMHVLLSQLQNATYAFLGLRSLAISFRIKNQSDRAHKLWLGWTNRGTASWMTSIV